MFKNVVPLSTNVRYVPQNPIEDGAKISTEKSIAAEEQQSVFDRPHISKPLISRVPENAILGQFKKKKEQIWKSNDFAEFTEEKPLELHPSIKGISKKRQHYDSPDQQDQTQYVYQLKLEQLEEICKPQMSLLDVKTAKDLAMQVVLCANVDTLHQRKTTRDLSVVIGQMVNKLAQVGIELPSDGESVVELLKIQISKMPAFIKSKSNDKDSIAGHLLPLLLLALRRDTPVDTAFTRINQYELVK